MKNNLRSFFVFTVVLLGLITTVSTLPGQTSAGTLLDNNGNVMRGIPVVISGNNEVSATSNAFATDPQTLIDLQQRGLNTIRLCLVDPFFEVQTDFNFWTIEQQLDSIDTVIENATALGINVILNYHSVGEHDGLKNLDMATANRYWQILAPRYANNDLVYYEILNEPTFQNSDYLDPTFKANLTALYRKVRQLAPQQQILMFSFSGIDFEMKQIIEAYSADIDWQFTSVAWHAYGEQETTLDKIRGLMQDYRMVCTEWDYPGRFSYVPASLDQFPVHAGALEAIGSSWMDWRDWDDASFNKVDNVLIPDSIERGYNWNVDSDASPEAPTPPVTLVVADIKISSTTKGRNVNASAEVAIVDGAGTPVSGVEVTVQWGGVFNSTATGTTNSEGIAFFSTSARTSPGEVTVTVTSLTTNGGSTTPDDDNPVEETEPLPQSKPGRGRKK